MATFQQIADRLIYRMSNRDDIGPSSSAGSRVYEFISEGLRDLAHRLKALEIRFPKLEAELTPTLAIGVDEVAFSTLDGTGRLYAILEAMNVTDKRPLRFANRAEMEQLRIQGTSGPPSRWSSFAEKLQVYPKPAASTALRLSVYNDPALITVVSGTPEISASFEHGLLLLAAAYGWRALENPRAGDEAEGEFGRWLQSKRLPDEHHKSARRASAPARPHPSRIHDSDLGI